jgi:hypothetical protein
MAELFLGEEHPVSKRRGTFEDDGASAWLYLSEPGGPRVIADAWAFNRVPPPTASPVQSYRPGPPPAAEGFAAPEALCPGPSARAWSLLWSEDGESVAVLRDGIALALVARAQRPGYSRLLIRSGPWGAVWDEDLFREVRGPGRTPCSSKRPQHALVAPPSSPFPTTPDDL